jgi:formimidoylglutamase
LKRPARYPSPSYHDPNDKRLVQIIRVRKRAEPRSVNILGVPYDAAVLGRKGAADGPQGIREAMTGFSSYNLELDVGLEDARIFDLGDVVFDSDDVAAAHVNVEEEVSSSVRKDALLVIIGGDNSITLPALEASSKKLGNLGLIVIDSHLDLRGKINGRPTSGSSYGLAIEKHFVSPKNVVEIGIHGFLNSRIYVEKARKLGVRLIAAEAVAKRGARTIAKEAYGFASDGVDVVYLSVDFDAIDLSQVSGVSAPSAGGISAQDLFTLVYEIAKRPKVKCVDFVELAPKLDPTGRSPRVAAGAVVCALAGYQKRT